MSLYVTYDNTSAYDGIGAQVHRIVCVMALARQLGLPYLHTFANRVRYQGHASQVQGTRDADYVQRWDRFLNLGQGLDTPESCGIEFAKEHRGVKLRLWSMLWLARSSGRASAWWKRPQQHDELLRIKSAFPIVNRFPASYELLRDELRDRYALFPKPPTCYSPERLNVAIHIRRGDVTPHSQYAHRYIANDVYVRLMRQMLAAVPDRRAEFHVFSEGDPAAPETGFEELTALPGVVLHLNEDVFSTFHHLVQADVLVLGVSSFSFVAGLYHRGLALNFPRHNPQLPTWLKLDRRGRFDAEEFRRRRLLMRASRRAA